MNLIPLVHLCAALVITSPVLLASATPYRDWAWLLVSDKRTLSWPHLWPTMWGLAVQARLLVDMSTKTSIA